MRVLIVGSLTRELGQAAQLAIARGTQIVHADDVPTGVACLRAAAFIDAVLCDVRMDVLGLLHALRTERIATPVIACGLDRESDAAIAAIRGGAREFLSLPPDPQIVAAILASIAGGERGLIVSDPVMAATVQRAEQVAVAEASVLITGESGTGKEVLARHIHRRSRRAQGPFVALNCAAIPEALLESELFGHEKGAFSGALARRIGKFEAAEGGTLLLDEIGEMDLRLQAKLLRAVQEREIDRVGGSAPVKVSVRILATTNRDLLAEVGQGRFREDLYFRLNVVSVRIPPLRERRGDIAALANYFARHYADINGVAQRPFTEAALQCMVRHSWRGNVRELENTVHRAVLLADGPTIAESAIELAGGAAAGPDALDVLRSDGAAEWVGRRMTDVERDLILQTLRHTAGNRTHAATILGISIRALRNKLRDYAAAGAAVPPPATGVAA